jgi:SPASM domain peptide maturase of grasp-with-spasm system
MSSVTTLNDQYFSLYSYCIPVLGKDSAIICNFQSASYTTIPLFIYEVLTEYLDYSISKISEVYNDENGDILKYFNLLAKRKVGLFTAEPNKFDKIEMVWKSPYPIASAVVEVKDPGGFNYLGLLDQLQELQCVHLELRFFDGCDLDFLQRLLNHSNESCLKSIDLLLPYYGVNRKLKKLTALVKESKKVACTVLYGTSDKIELIEDCIFSTDQLLNTSKSFKDIPADEYVINLPFFCESMFFNPYYNRKVGIDHEGNIKNCTSHEKSFGNINSHLLSDVIHTEEFRKLWFVNNDKIEGLKDSPLRYFQMITHELEYINTNNYRILDA